MNNNNYQDTSDSELDNQINSNTNVVRPRINRVSPPQMYVNAIPQPASIAEQYPAAVVHPMIRPMAPHPNIHITTPPFAPMFSNNPYHYTSPFYPHHQEYMSMDSYLLDPCPIRILTGSVGQILEWNDHHNHMILYEVTAQLVCISTRYPAIQPSPGNEINLIIRDRFQMGPSMQVIHPYYLFPEFPPNLIPGLLVRCIGKITEGKRLVAAKISAISPYEEGSYNRLAHVSRYTY